MPTARAGVLEIAFESHGADGGWPVVLLHGFPYDVRCFDGVVPGLVQAGAHVVVPYLRGYGPTRFLDPGTVRSGQQAALAHDLLALIESLDLERPLVAGFDWGGRAACLVSALWPERVGGLLSVGGYNVQDIAAADRPAPPASEHGYWYQYYLHSERGRNGLTAYRSDLCRLLWEQWSPTWHFDDDEFAATAPSFENPDFVDVVVHSYRHRYGLADGDPAYDHTEELIAAQPRIEVPTVVLDPTRDGLGPASVPETHARHFTRIVDRRLVEAGHNPAQEQPAVFTEALLALRPAGR